jgi:hypothetical protein
MSATFFILNGPKAGDLLPYSNAPSIRQKLNDWRWIDYEPAPIHCCYALGPCVAVVGTQFSTMPSGNIVMAHPGWVRTLLNPRTGEIKEIEDDMIGAGT